MRALGNADTLLIPNRCGTGGIGANVVAGDDSETGPCAFDSHAFCNVSADDIAFLGVT